MEGNRHQELKRLALFVLKKLSHDLIATEVPFGRIDCIADAVGINMGKQEVRVIEVKTSRADYLRDHKLWGPTAYTLHAHYAYIMCPTNLLAPTELPPHYGLIWVSETDAYEVVKNPKRLKDKLGTSYEETLSCTAKRLSNAVLYREEPKDLTRGAGANRARLWLTDVRCPRCRKHDNHVLHDASLQVTCPHCKAVVTLADTRLRRLSGFNKRFTQELLTAAYAVGYLKKGDMS